LNFWLNKKVEMKRCQCDNAWDRPCKLVYKDLMLPEEPGAETKNVVQMNNTLADDRNSDQEVSAVAIKSILDYQHATQ
jgi:hypothetical protein